MHIETYSDRFYLDVVNIVNNFYDEAIKLYDVDIDRAVLADTITKVTANNSGNVFLLVNNDKCEGVLAGIEIQGLLNRKKVFQEIIWYINKPFRRYGVALLKKAQEILKAEGFNTIIMAVLENSKTEKIKRLYERMGFINFESHWIRSL